MVRVRVGLQILAISATALMAGCAEGTKHPPTHPVKGSITLDGKPLAGALVSFIPASGQQPANGTTDASGGYTLTSFTRGDGIMVGDYRVVVTKFPPTAGSGSGEGEYVPPTGEMQPPKNELPAKYAAPETSGFTASVVAGGGTFDFALTR